MKALIDVVILIAKLMSILILIALGLLFFSLGYWSQAGFDLFVVIFMLLAASSWLAAGWIIIKKLD